MDELDQSPLVSSSSGPARPQQPQFNYQFVLDDEKEEEEEEEEEDEDEDFDEQLEVMERKPAPAPAAAPQERPPQLLDLGGPAEPPRPAAPEPPQPDWSPRGAVSSSSSSATTPSPAQEQPPAPARPAQPQPPKPEPAVAPRSRGSSSGSADETLFALPATPAPLMHSSAEKVMDLQEQPGNTKSLGQEDFSAVSLDPAPSLPSFSPLSADPFKEHAAFGTLSDGFPPARGTYKESSSEVYKEPMKNARNPFLAEGNDKDISEMKYSQPPFAKEEAAILSPAKEKTQLEGPKELPNLEKAPAQQLKMSLESPQDLFERNEEDDSFNKDKYGGSGDHGEKGVLKEDPLRREEYADFKPFEPIWEVKGASHGLSSMREDVGSKIDAKPESSLDDKYGVGKLNVQKDYERESEGSAEEPSFPSTPEAVKEPSQTYITCTKFDSPPSPGGNKGKSLSPLEEGTSENRTDDEKKIAELKAQTGPEQGNFAAGVAGQEGQRADPAKAQGVPPVPPDSAANMPEGLTPDLVQEAYEMHDAACTKLAYEPKIDLVQTSEAAQETLKPAAQICPSFEGSEAAPSPILPDIVMEAPLSTGTAGAEASAVQLEASPLETFMPTAKYENVKEAEKPPVYQEAVKVPLTQAQEAKETLAFKQPDGESSSTPEDLETPYISIACDLIKGTKVSGESPSPSFTEYSKMPVTESISQDVPEDKELDGTLSPQFGKAGLFNSQMISDFAEEESEDPSLFKSKSTESIATDEEHEEGLVDSVAATGKPYLESFQPELDSSKIVAAPPSEPIIAKADKIPLQMEELDALAYSADVSVAMEPKTGDDKALSPMESSPISVEEDFVMLGHPKTIPEFVTEATDREIMHKGEGEDISKVIQGEKRQLPCPELPCDLSVKNVEVKAEEDTNALKKSLEAVDREVPEVSTMSLPATDTSPLSAEKELVSVVKPRAFEKEAEKEAASVKEKKKPTAVFSAKLNKSSVVDLLYWRDIKKTGVVFGASLFLLLSLTVFSIVSVTAYIALALLSVTISFRIYKGVIQAIQKSDEGHPFRAYLDSDVAVSEELIQKYSNVVLGHVNGTVRELRRLFLVDDLVDSLKFAVLMWVFTYVGALFNGLTLLILALISLFSVPVIYERHQAQIDHYLGLVNKNVKDAMAKIQAKIPGLKRKTE
ncbi:PREDICTED: reticulon-4 isoform X2 [Pseudopodoces humilis]|uniref:reticulon-4 isoform X1 n=1 Tax=Pseudopodoces humilis TaxID=181119 RepID=UPI0006B6ACB7|nr:PREDICTED: reticulon-4 isoform X1 [Pseudopodoces humilis]XP_014110121.1 PREDICTED: reticulon-4 isoform X2 [Pseudopodoces humilis]